MIARSSLRYALVACQWKLALSRSLARRGQRVRWLVENDSAAADENAGEGEHAGDEPCDGPDNLRQAIESAEMKFGQPEQHAIHDAISRINAVQPLEQLRLGQIQPRHAPH